MQITGHNLFIMTLIRLQKFLSRAGVCSRREGEKYITSGKVSVNGEIITRLGTKINMDTDLVKVNGTSCSIVDNLVYVALNKPEGYVTSCSQPGDNIVLDLIDIEHRIYPVGRLDKDSTGLLILTNDGDLHHRLLHPSFDHEKEYEVVLKKPLQEKALKSIEKGLPLMGTKTRPATIKKLSPKIFRIILKEGKNRQIRRMVRKVGGRVEKLKRIRFANINLQNLSLGKWRYLTEKEKKKLINQQF